MTVGDFVLVNTISCFSSIRPLDRLRAALPLDQAVAHRFEQMLELLRPAGEVPRTPPMPAPCRRDRARCGSSASVSPTIRAGPVLRDVSSSRSPGPHPGDRRPERCGQIHHRPAAVPLLRPDRGRALTLDGADMREFTQSSLRSAIAVVPQDPCCSTIRSSTTSRSAGPSAAAEIEGRRPAQIHDFITSCPMATPPMVGERGLKLSGGEKQRVAIARAMLKRPRDMFLDEATSPWTRTELAIRRKPAGSHCRGTTLVIAHRLSTIDRCRRNPGAGRRRHRRARQPRLRCLSHADSMPVSGASRPPPRRSHRSW